MSLMVALLVMLCCAAVQARTDTIGFAQSDTAESDWRKANTESFKEVAKELGIQLPFKDAGGKTEVPGRHVEEFTKQKVYTIHNAAVALPTRKY